MSKGLLQWKTLRMQDRPGVGPIPRPEARPCPDGYQRLFRRTLNMSDRRNRRAHYVDALDDPALGTLALCGKSPEIGEQWYGKGSRSDEDEVNRMADCKHCVATLEKRT